MIILYNPPSTAQRKPVLPMSLLALGAVLDDEYEYAIVDGNLAHSPVEAVAGAVRERGARYLGVTVMGGPQLEHAVRDCAALKKLFPDLVIIWGGYFPTQHYEVCLQADYVDYVVRGHGEYAFRDLIALLEARDRVPETDGVAFRNTETGAVSAGAVAAIPNPDALPDFPYQRIDVARYIRKTFMGRRTLPHHSSYGCPFLCNFCAVVNLVNGRWLAQSAENTARVVHRLAKEWRVDAVEFYDNNFFVHEDRTVEFAERIQPLDLGWWGEARVDTLLKYSHHSWEAMRDSGLRMVFLGAESGSDETLRRMNKGGKATAEKTLDIAAKMRRFGIVPEFSFVLGNPPEPEEDAENTIEFIRRVKRVNPSAEIILYMYTPVPVAGSLFEEAKAAGFQFPGTLEDWVSPEWRDFAQRRGAHIPWMNDRLRSRVRDFQRVLNAYYPTSTDTNLRNWERSVLRAAGGWRYKTRIYSLPIELRLLQRMMRYQRPETSGF